MARVLIGNDWDEHLREARPTFSWWADRLAWLARDGDVLVLPMAMDESYLGYVTGYTGVDQQALTVIVPPADASSPGMLTGSRVADPRLADAILAALGSRPVDEIVPLWPHASVAVLAERLNAPAALPGHAFVSQRGGAMVNSKAIFRAVSAGAGLSLPAGAVCPSIPVAEEAITQMIEQGHSVMVKREYGTGGGGNEVLSLTEGLRPLGARRTVLATDRAAVREYLEKNWDWLTDAGTHLMVAERYFTDSRACYAEFWIGEDETLLGGLGEMMYAPQYLCELLPPQIESQSQAELIDGARKLCAALHAVGYRGWLSADAIVTPDRQVLFTEWNGRFTSSTHIHDVIGKVLVGPDYSKDRLLLSNIWPRGWATPSFEAMRDVIAGAGLAFDPETRTGVLIASGHDKVRLGAIYCVISPDIDSAWDVNQQLGELFIPA